ncbi:hypothetical protein AAE478_008369 [Parahypoxylon ruwenzoriense]
MVYILEFYVDGGCRGNGHSDAIGAAAACLMTRGNNYYHRKRRLDDYDYPPTSQRAEITAIIMALEWALEKYEELDSSPRLNLKIKSDSKYAVGCMTEWVYKWANNGWINSNGNKVANRDLIKEASDLDDEVKKLGSVKYIWVPREQNTNAHDCCDEALDD